MVKFDHFEIRVMNHLPSAEKFNGVTVPQPVFYNVGRTIIALFGSCHISKGDIILFFYREDGDWCILNDNFSHVSDMAYMLMRKVIHFR